MDLPLIEQTYVAGQVDECFNLVTKQFTSVRNNYTFGDLSPKYLHKCNRDEKCRCIQLGTYLIAIAHHSNNSNVRVFLESNFFLEPDVRLPFKVFTQWVQLEIFNGSFTEASYLIKNYIQ